MCRGRTFR
uniref:Uncharacterized protein n=1 Tax=Anguilla anguilla TaxID=7936 RepID=A0A0E9UNL9_ANGAN